MFEESIRHNREDILKILTIYQEFAYYGKTRRKENTTFKDFYDRLEIILFLYFLVFFFFIETEKEPL